MLIRLGESTDTVIYYLIYQRNLVSPNLLGFFDIWDNLFLNFNMAWKVTSINMDMIRDWYSIWDAMVYSRLWWLSRHTNEADCLYPSQKKMAEDLCMSERQIIRCLQNLENTWLIEMSHRWYKRRNNYYVCSLLNYPCDVKGCND